MPLIDSAAPDRAPIVAAGALTPPATPASSSAGRVAVAKCARGEIRVIITAVIASSDIPPISTRRTPIAGTSFPPEIAAAKNDGTVVASQARPVCVGE